MPKRLTRISTGRAQNKDFFRQEVVPSWEIKSWIAKNFDGDHSVYNLWLDVVGYDEETYKVMGEAFEMDAETLSDALLFRYPSPREPPPPRPKH